MFVHARVPVCVRVFMSLCVFVCVFIKSGCRRVSVCICARASMCLCVCPSHLRAEGLERVAGLGPVCAHHGNDPVVMMCT